MAWLPKQTVVVPVDFSDESIAAVDAALELVADASHLHIIHVLPIITDYEAGLVWSTVSDQTRTEHAQLALRERLADAKYEKVRIAVAFGDAGTEIAAFAENKQADLIVIPSHGRTGLKRLLIGSVAERVVRLAHCPVLVLKPAT
jgi:nucleotide-binding universal stress UspA family protein